MYHPRTLSAIQSWYQPTLFQTPAPEPGRRLRHGPAFVLTKPARIAVLSVRQYLGHPIHHPDDLWRHPDRHRGVSETFSTSGNGQATNYRLTLDKHGGDPQLLRRIMEAEDRWKAAAAAVEYLAALGSRIADVAKMVVAPERVSVGQIESRLDRLTAFRQFTPDEFEGA